MPTKKAATKKAATKSADDAAREAYEAAKADQERVAKEWRAIQDAERAEVLKLSKAKHPVAYSGHDHPSE